MDVLSQAPGLKTAVQLDAVTFYVKTTSHFYGVLLLHKGFFINGAFFFFFESDFYGNGGERGSDITLEQAIIVSFLFASRLHYKEETRAMKQ